MLRTMMRAMLAFVFAILTLGAASANAQGGDQAGAPPPTDCQHQNPTTPQTLFPGVGYQAVTVVCGAQQQHTTLAHVLTIDVGSGSIRLGSSTVVKGAFGLALPSRFLTGTNAQLAVNANLFNANTCCHYSAAYQGLPTQLCGWQVSGGKTQSPQGAKPTGCQADYPFNASLVQMKDGGVRIVYSNTPQAIEWPVATAVTGSHMLVFGGKSLGPFSGSSADFFGPNARTLAGLSKDGKTLWLVTLDAGTGLTLDEAAAVMLQQGAVAAINLDGGGSSTMVQAASGGFAFLNAPADWSSDCLAPYPNAQSQVSCERLVGTSLGVYVAGQGGR